jgi:hypothetical protein
MWRQHKELEMNVWNLIGIFAWLVLLAYLIFMINNIRSRHLRMIVVHGKKRSGRTIAIDIAEVVVLLAAAYGLFFAAWVRPVDYASGNDVTVKHEYAPLVMQIDDDQQYYVTVQSQTAKSPLRHYTYWSEGTKVQVSSQNADVAADASPLPISASAYPWSKKKLIALDKTTDKAFAATVTARYKNNFLNGLGMRAGREADYFTIIRVPNKQLINVQPLNK